MKGHANAMLANKGVQALAVCDVNRARRDFYKANVDASYAAGSGSGSYKGCAAYNEHEHIIGRDDIDAVIVGTPDHWHVPNSLAAFAHARMFMSRNR